MKAPTMPKELKDNLRYFFSQKDVNAIVELNKAWNKYIQDLQEQELAEKGE